LARVEIDVVIERKMIKKARILYLVFLFRYCIYNVLFLIKIQGDRLYFLPGIKCGTTKEDCPPFYEMQFKDKK